MDTRHPIRTNICFSFIPLAATALFVAFSSFWPFFSFCLCFSCLFRMLIFFLYSCLSPATLSHITILSFYYSPPTNVSLSLSLSLSLSFYLFLSLSFYLSFIPSIIPYFHGILRCLERKTQEKIRALEEELSKERETFAQKLDQMKAEYEKNRTALESHEAKLREQVESLEKVLNLHIWLDIWPSGFYLKENKRMESEMQNLATRFCELEKLNCILQSELESDSYRKKVSTLSSSLSLSLSLSSLFSSLLSVFPLTVWLTELTLAVDHQMEDTDPMQILLSEQQYKHLLQQLEEAKRQSKVSIRRLLRQSHFTLFPTHINTRSHIHIHTCTYMHIH